MTTRVSINVCDGHVDLDVAIGSESDDETRRLVEAVTAGVLSALEGARAIPRRRIGPTETKDDESGRRWAPLGPPSCSVEERIDHG